MVIQHTDKLISSILKHDNKQNSYKIALLRSINDVVLAYPDVMSYGHDVAIPLQMLARYWIAYYWPFVEEHNPIYQGVRARFGEIFKNDMSFRPELTWLRSLWTSMHGTSNSSDGFLLTHNMLVPRKRKEYERLSNDLVKTYYKTLRKIVSSIEQPMRYAGTSIEGEFSVFQLLNRFENSDRKLASIPGTHLQDRCIVIPIQIWKSFRDLSLWVEALCIHEWSLFIEGVDQKDRGFVRRGEVFELLTSRPDNRIPLDWERNRIFILMEEGIRFRCVWTHQEIGIHDRYDLDHLVPVSVYPMNEMWNLVPSHPSANIKKSDKIPSSALLSRAKAHLSQTYEYYRQDQSLSIALNEDSRVRFSTLENYDSSIVLAACVIDFMEQIADARNLARIENF